MSKTQQKPTAESRFLEFGESLEMTKPNLLQMRTLRSTEVRCPVHTMSYRQSRNLNPHAIV